MICPFEQILEKKSKIYLFIRTMILMASNGNQNFKDFIMTFFIVHKGTRRTILQFTKVLVGLFYSLQRYYPDYSIVYKGTSRTILQFTKVLAGLFYSLQRYQPDYSIGYKGTSWTILQFTMVLRTIGMTWQCFRKRVTKRQYFNFKYQF